VNAELIAAAAAEVRAASEGGNPTASIGSMLPERAPSGIIPGWTVVEAQRRLVPVDALKWPRSNRTYEDMRRDPQVQGLLQSFFLPIRQFEWAIDPNGTAGTVADEIAEDFGLPIAGESTVTENTGIDFDEILRLGLLATANGHRFFEEAGILDDDGKFRLRELQERPPTTISRFDIDPDGSLISIRQYGKVPPAEIPFERLVSFVWDKEGANWAGRPLLYGLYRPWLLKDELIRGDASTHRRFAGIPYTQQTVPGAVDETGHKSAAEAMRALRSGDGSGMTFPYGMEPKILSGDAGSSAINSAEYHDRQMSRAFMQMFAELGSSQHGSHALGVTLLDHFTLGVITVAKWAQKATQVAIRREVTRNYGPEAAAPQLTFQEERAQELTPEQLVALVEAGVIVADDDLEEAVRQRGTLPPRNKAEEGRTPPKTGAQLTSIAAAAAEPGTPAAESKTDFAGLQRTHESALANLTAMWTGVQAAQILDLAKQIREAPDVEALAQITPDVLGDAPLAKALDPVIEHGAQTAIDAAKAQGHELDEPDLTATKATLADAAKATATMLAQALGQSAASKATSLASLPNDEIASQVTDYLHGLAGATPEYEIAGLLTQAQNEGRFAAMEASPKGTSFYASELNDTNTCEPCKHEDGDKYPTLAEARRDYPAGGFLGCLGGKRCRGTIIAVYPETKGQARS
jgi:hypothetical protein